MEDRHEVDSEWKKKKKKWSDHGVVKKREPRKQRRTMKSDLENRSRDSISRPIDLFIPDLLRPPKSRSRSIESESASTSEIP